MEIISSKTNKIVKEIKSLEDKKHREKNGVYFVEGEKVVLEAIKYVKDKIKFLITTPEVYKTFENISDLKTIIVTKEIFDYISNTKSPQYLGLVLDYSFNDIKNFDKPFLVLDHIQDPGNLGTIIRTAVATGFNDIVLINSVDPYSPKVVRSTSSGVFTTNFYKLTYDEFNKYIIENKIMLLVAEAGKNNIFDKNLTIPKTYGLVIGSEGQGVSNEILSIKHMSISLPMNENMESLNAAISASIIMYNLKNR